MAAGLEEAGSWSMGRILKALKLLFGAAGVIVGLLGIIFTVSAYLVISPAISALQDSTTGELGTIYITLGDTENLMANGADAMDAVAPAAENASDALETYGNGSVKLANALKSIGDTLELVSGLVPVPKDTIDNLKSGAGLAESGAQMKKTANMTREIGAKAGGAAESMRKLKTDIGQSKDNVNDAKQKITDAFGALKTALLLALFIGIFLFLGLIACSIAAAI